MLKITHWQLSEAIGTIFNKKKNVRHKQLCLVYTEKLGKNKETHYSMVPAHHGKTALQQFQAKHCLVSTVIAKMGLFGEKYHVVAK